MIKPIYIFSVFLILFGCDAKSQSSNEWKLTWSDEFNYTGIPDSSKWSYEVGGSGWGNNEKQYYTQGDTLNAIVKNGALAITARNIKSNENDYTSARLTTKNKEAWKYGRIEVSAKLPPGRGLWPAVWMLGENINEAGWPKCGEIDIMEHVGFMKDSIFGTVHTEAYNHVKKKQRGAKVFIKNPYSEFHTYTVEWSSEKVNFLLDDVMYFSFSNEHKTVNEWPFDQPFYLLLNIAVGGNFGGQKGIDNTALPASMLIDYVRVYQKF